MPRSAIILLPHDPDWAGMFLAEQTRLAAALGLPPSRVEHIGSTAVDGLAARPIIDIQVEMPGELGDEALAAIQAAEYELAGDQIRPGRLVFLKGAGSRHHLYAYASGHPEIEQHRKVRDWLRLDPELRGEYEAVKRRLAATYGYAGGEYSEGKGAFVRGVLAAIGRAPSSDEV